MKQTIHVLKRAVTTLCAVALLLGMVPQTAFSQSASDLQRQLSTLDGQINETQAQVSRLRAQADTYENQLSILKAEQRQLQKEINRTEQEINQTRRDIDSKQAELDRARELIQENARILYKQGNPSVLEVLFASNNFTEFINQQEYLNKARDSVNEAAKESIAIKTELEIKEEELEVQALKLDTQKYQLGQKRAEQQRLVDRTRGEERRYQAYVAELRQKQKQTDRQLAAAIAAANSGGFINGGGSGGSGLLVNAGATVVQGQHIAYVGSSGFSTGPHLDFMVYGPGGGTVSPNGTTNSFSTNLSYGFSWPVRHTKTINVPYGSNLPCSEVYYPTCSSRSDTYSHYGIDIPAYMGEPVLAAAAGVVVFSGWLNDGGGYSIIIEHANGYRTRYSHLNS